MREAMRLSQQAFWIALPILVHVVFTTLNKGGVARAVMTAEAPRGQTARCLAHRLIVAVAAYAGLGGPIGSIPTSEQTPARLLTRLSPLVFSPVPPTKAFVQRAAVPRTIHEEALPFTGPPIPGENREIASRSAKIRLQHDEGHSH